MASERRGKRGLDYYPLDVDIFSDEKVAYIVAKYNALAENVLLHTLNRIYRNGYWIEWSEDLALLIAREIYHPEANGEYVKKIIEEAAVREFFNADIYHNYSILTSHRIQSNYFHAVKRRKESVGNPAYLLLDQDERERYGLTVTRTSLNDNTETENVDNQEINDDYFPVDYLPYVEAWALRAKNNFKTVKIDKVKFGKAIQGLFEIDKISKEDYSTVCKAVFDPSNFWFKNIQTPMKLRVRMKKESGGMMYWEYILQQGQKQTNGASERRGW